MASMTKHTLIDCFTLRARIGWQGLRSDEFKTEGAYLVTGWDFVNGRINWDDCYHVSVDRFEQDKGIQLRENDLLVTKDGTVGKTAFVVDCPTQATLNSHIFLVRSKDGSVEPEYLYYLLNSAVFSDFMRNILTGTTIKGLTQGNFYKFEFEAPDVPTQKKIVSVLESIDDVIDKTRDLIEKYTSLMKGVVQDILTNDINDENTVKIGSFADALGGKRIPKGSELTIAKTAHPYIRVRDMTKPKVIELTDDYMYVEESDFHKISRYIVNAGDLIISIVGTVGAVALVGETLDKANLTENCSKIVNIKGYSPEFLYYFLKSEYGQKEIAGGTVGEVQAKLPLKNILEINVPILSMPEQEAIVEKLRILDEKIDKEVQYYNKMESIKAGLMHDLLSGSIDAL